MKKRNFLSVLILILLFVSVSAHSGNTDSSGGHYDRSTGEYHYHHGKPAHQHPNGICPYRTNSTKNLSFERGGSDVIRGYLRGHEDGIREGKADGIEEGKAERQPEIDALKEKVKYALITAGVLLLLTVILIRKVARSYRREEQLLRDLQYSREHVNRLQASKADIETQLIDAKRTCSRLQKQLEQALAPPPTLQRLPLKAPLDSRLKTFGQWPSAVHDSQKQFLKLQRAETEPHKVGTTAPYPLARTVSVEPPPRTGRTPLDVSGSPFVYHQESII